MAKKKQTAKTGEGKTSVRKHLFTTGIVLFVLYIGIHILSRTEGARSAVADKLSNGTRQLITLESCGMTPLLGLRLEGLGFYGVEIPEARVSFNWLYFFSKEKPFVKRLHIRDLDVEFRRAPDGVHWEPAVLHGIGSRLGEVLGIPTPEPRDNDALPKFPAHVINAKTLLQLDRAGMVWRDATGREIAYLSAADLKVETGTFIKRKVIQSIVKCGHIKLASGNALRDFRLETFRIEGSGIVTVLDMADSNGLYDEFATQVLWQDLSLRLNELAKIR